MRDLFGTPINGKHYDLFGTKRNEFHWIVGVFSGSGAVEVIKRAHEIPLATYFPIRRNVKGEYIPLWANYLFIEFRESVTIDLCRTTARFIKVISERDEDGVLHPVLIRKHAINESLKLMTQGKFDDIEFKRRTYGRGTIVRVIEGNFIDKRVRLEMAVTPEMNGRTKVRVDIDGIRATIELYKLAL
jgi:hypothetical protein